MSPLWYTDRSRFMRGFECRWKRLLEYHAFRDGIVGRGLATPLLTGRYVHSALESLLHFVKNNEQAPDIGVVNQLLVKVLQSYQEQIEKDAAASQDEAATQLDLVVGITHAYARVVVPYLKEHFRIVDIERELSWQLPDSNIIWMARPDFTAEQLLGGELTTHDFKTTSYWNNETGPLQWANSAQMMANAWAVSQTSSRPLGPYYMHMLVKGNAKYPNLLTHAFYRPGNPPLVKEEWQANYTRQKGFSRVRIAAYRNLPEWIWEADTKALGEKLPVVGPYPAHQTTCASFFRGVVVEEKWWQEQTEFLDGVDWNFEWPRPEFQKELDEHFPRTYACHDFSGRKCQFYSLCHKQPGWVDPLAVGSHLRRTLNHPQEGGKK